MSQEEGRQREEAWVGDGRKQKKMFIRGKKEGEGSGGSRGGGRKGLILDSIPKEISGLGQTAHTLSKITV